MQLIKAWYIGTYNFLLEKIRNLSNNLNAQLEYYSA